MVVLYLTNLFVFFSGRELNFRARSYYEPHEWLPYDYNSVMHYRAIAFSKDSLTATIVPKDNKAFFAIGQRVRFSPMDLAKLNALYNCGPSYYRGGHTHSPSSETEKGVPSEEDLFYTSGMKKDTSSTKPENDLFSKPETEIETSPSKREENLFSKSGLEKNMSLPKPKKDIPTEGSFSKPGIEK
jgi:hypothetical protein